MFNADNLPVFLAVLDHGSFSAAARSLGRVPSAVSMAIAHLEAELGLQLFDRSGREPRPTPAARALESQARLLAAQAQQLHAQALALSQGVESRLTLAIAPELLTAPWSRALQGVAADWPLLEIEVLAAPQADALAMLHSGRAQLALVFERPSLDGREGFQEIASDTLVLVMAAEHPVLRELGAERRLREQHLTGTRQIVVAGRDPETPDSRFVFARHLWRTDNALAALSLIAAGFGWGWLPRSLVAPHIAAGRLVEMSFENFSNGIDLCVDVVWSKERPLGPAAQRFVASMREAGHVPSPTAGAPPR